MSVFRNWVPVPKISPLHSFPERLIAKWSAIFKNLIWNLKNKLGFSGVRVIGLTPSGNTQLQFKCDSSFGPKGFVIELPRDDVIFKSVRRHRSWEIHESNFLARGLRKAIQESRLKTALIDIGANTGLVTLQALNLSDASPKVFLFEPIPRHTTAISQNLKGKSHVQIFNFALSNKNGTAEIFTEESNHGNSSLLNSVVDSFEQIVTQVKLVDTTEFFRNSFSEFENFIIKCDTQGMDAVILSRIPSRIWQKVECAVVEVWAVNEINEYDVDILLPLFQGFEFVSWVPNINQKVKISEIRTFWLGKTKAHRNLFLSKTNFNAWDK
jgi:FkbM family methyltransferase